MSRYLLDTSTLIDFSKGFQPVESRLLTLIANKETIGVAAISVAEFYAGIAPERHATWQQFFDTFDYWAISYAAAIRAGHYLYTYARRGLTLSTTDTLLAAIAHEQNATLVTDNIKDYPMPDVQVLSLRQAP